MRERPALGRSESGRPVVSGQRETANGFTVNGSSVQEDFNMFAAVIPNLDSIQEFRVLTSNFDAEYGNFSGGQVVVTTNRGRTSCTATRSSFCAIRISPRETSLRRRGPGMTGTSSAAPSAVRCGEDKAFFFVDYQGTRMTRGVDTGLISVPSLNNGQAISRTSRACSLERSTGSTGRSGCRRSSAMPSLPASLTIRRDVEQRACVFPSAVIPQRRGRLRRRTSCSTSPNQIVGRTDVHDIRLQPDSCGTTRAAARVDLHTRFGILSGYYFADDYTFDNPYPTGQAGANVPGFNALSLGRAQMATLGLTTTLGPTAVNEIRLSYLRTANNVGQPVGGVGPTLVSQGFVDAQGNPGIVPLAPEIEGIENLAFNDFTIGVNITGVVQANNTFQLTDNFSKVAGRHLLKFGANAHGNQINIAPNATYNGTFMFQGTETGSDFADYLLGIASVYAQGDSKHFYPRNRYAGLYGQDRWQIRPDLTHQLRSSLGHAAAVEREVQPVANGGARTAVRGLSRRAERHGVSGRSGIPSTLAPTRYTNFAPRVGLAWTPFGDAARRPVFARDSGCTTPRSKDSPPAS